MVTQEKFDEVCEMLDMAIKQLNDAHEVIERYKKACDTAKSIIDEKNKIIEGYNNLVEELKSKI